MNRLPDIGGWVGYRPIWDHRLAAGYLASEHTDHRAGLYTKLSRFPNTLAQIAYMFIHPGLKRGY